MRGKILIIAHSNYYPSDRFRLLQFIPYLIKEGYFINVIFTKPNTYYKPNSKCKIIFWTTIYLAKYIRILYHIIKISQIKKQSYNYILINRPLIPNGKIKCFEKKLFNKEIPVIFDFDDAIYLIDKYKDKLDFYISQATKVVVSNSILADYSKVINSKTFIIPTVIDHLKYKKKKTIINELDTITFGWIGTFDAMRFALPAIKNALRKINKNPKFRFVIISNKEPTDDLISIPYIFYKWCAEKEIYYLNNIDIGIMPLVYNLFQEAKSGAKLLQYMGLGIPAIATPLGVNKEIIKNGINGFLANDEDEWYSIMNNIMNNKYNLEKISEAAFETAHQNYSIKTVLPKLIEILT